MAKQETCTRASSPADGTVRAAEGEASWDHEKTQLYFYPATPGSGNPKPGRAPFPEQAGD